MTEADLNALVGVFLAAAVGAVAFVKAYIVIENL